MKIIKKIFSKDGQAVKYLQKLEEGFFIETSYVDFKNKHIICFSSQVGCPIGCRFCVTGLGSRDERFRRSLTVKELVAQCENIIKARHLRSSKKPLLFSCMGEGEPLLNYRNVVLAMKKLSQKYPNSHLALSTSGILPGRIRELAKEKFSTPFKLQISLHAPNDKIRRSLMPTSSPIRKIISAAKYYHKISGRPVEWNYVLLAGVNDSQANARQLVTVLGSGWHVKLNAFNACPGNAFCNVSNKTRTVFIKTLEKGGLSAEFYRTNGADIAAACGQLKYGIV